MMRIHRLNNLRDDDPCVYLSLEFSSIANYPECLLFPEKTKMQFVSGLSLNPARFVPKITFASNIKQ